MIIGGIVIAVIVLYGIIVYNSVVSRRNKIKEALAAIDVYLQNRFDALTQIAETVVSYAKHEREALTELTMMRQKISALPASTDKITQLEQVEEGLRNINVQVEAYPDLKASDNYLHLQRTINDQEEKLSAARRTYNANATSYNSYIASIPNNIFASIFGFKEADLLNIDESKKAEVNVKNILRG